jgi:hypothetical protein
MKNTVFWDVNPCSSVEVHGHFRGMCCLNLPTLLLAGCLIGFFVEPEDEGSIFLRNMGDLPDYTALHPRNQYSLFSFCSLTKMGDEGEQVI